MTFHVGQKVVMINRDTNYDKSVGIKGWPECINVDGVYTVRDVDTRAAELGWPVVLRFEEHVFKTHQDPRYGIWEPGFPGDCFRPVTDRQTDISVFTEMLHTSKVHVDV